MGSLLGGWDSSVSDPKFVQYQRNSSLTKGEIEAYWKTKKIEEEHLGAISASPDSSQERTYQRSSSLPLADTDGNLTDTKTEKSLETALKKNAWWTRSNWAFLNDRPVIEPSEGPSK